MKLGDYHFVPTFWPSLFFLVLLPFFLALGVWQLNRADEKIAILASLKNKSSSEPKSIGAIDVGTAKYSKVYLSGELLTEKQFLLDNKVYKAVAGYELIAPIELTNDGRIVLLSRGWVAQGRTRSDLPNVELHVASPIEITGLFVRPSKGYTIGKAINTESEDWPKVIQYLDYQKIGELLGSDVIEGVILPDEPLGKELPQLWQPIAFGPEKHFGYAAQWFAISFVLLLLYFVLNTKKEEAN